MKCLTEAEIKSLKGRQLSNENNELYAYARDLGSVANFKKMRVHHEILMPGDAASIAHEHSTLEEMIVVQQGCVTLEHDGKVVGEVGPGGCVMIPPQSGLHRFINRGVGPAEYVSIATCAENDIVNFQQ